MLRVFVLQAMALVRMSSDGQRWSRTSVDETSTTTAGQPSALSPRRHSSAIHGLWTPPYACTLNHCLERYK